MTTEMRVSIRAVAVLVLMAIGCWIVQGDEGIFPDRLYCVKYYAGRDGDKTGSDDGDPISARRSMEEIFHIFDRNEIRYVAVYRLEKVEKYQEKFEAVK